MTNTFTKKDMQLNVFFQKSNTSEDYFLDLINQPVISRLFYHLWGLVYGYDKNSTEPSNLLTCQRKLLNLDDIDKAHSCTLRCFKNRTELFKRFV